jgi:hypothetical protein
MSNKEFETIDSAIFLGSSMNLPFSSIDLRDTIRRSWIFDTVRGNNWVRPMVYDQIGFDSLMKARDDARGKTILNTRFMPGLISTLIKKSHDLPFRATHILRVHHIQPYNGWLSSAKDQTKFKIMQEQTADERRQTSSSQHHPLSLSASSIATVVSVDSNTDTGIIMVAYSISFLVTGFPVVSHQWHW